MDRIQGPEIKPQVYDQLIFNMVIKTLQWDYSFLSTNYGGQTGHPPEKYNNYLIKEQDLNVSTKTIKILGKT